MYYPYSIDWDAKPPEDAFCAHGWGRGFIDYADKERRGKCYSVQQAQSIRGICSIDMLHICYRGKHLTVDEMVYACRKCKYAGKNFIVTEISELTERVVDCSMRDICCEDSVRLYNIRYDNLIAMEKQVNRYKDIIAELKDSREFMRDELGDVYKAVMKEYRRTRKNA